MEKVIQYLKDNKNLIKSISFSSKKDKSSELRGIFISFKKDGKLKVEFRLTKHNDIKDMAFNDFIELVEKEIIFKFKQILIKLENEETQILLNKRNESKFISNKQEAPIENKKHNRSKNYLIPEGTPCDFLFEIGVMTNTGKVRSQYYKKFKQINRFLEMVDDLYKKDDLKTINAVDFGSGKSYLTFALYHYFSHIKKVETKITGIDLKQEVIDNCNRISKKLNYTGLNFVHGFIHDFKSDTEKIDFVVTLHACDTATDDAILFALKHDATKMIFVPCCQHELNKQLQNEDNKLLIEHGVYRDKMCAIITDNLRAKLLESKGYKVQIMEFIETDHTAKNIMLRCQKVNRSEEQKNKALDEYKSFVKKWNVTPYLEKKLVLQS